MTNEEFLRIRRTLSLTQLQLAKYLEISERSIGGYERGEQAIPKVVGLAVKMLCLEAEPEER